MADILLDGSVKVSFVPTIVNKSAPTVAELTAGTSLENTLTAAGLEGFEPSTSRIDNTSLGSRFGTTVPGRTNFGDMGLLLKKQTGTDTVFTTLSTKNIAGYIVIRDAVAHETAWTAADKVAVYPMITGEFGWVRENDNILRYRVPIGMSGSPDQQAVVAA